MVSHRGYWGIKMDWQYLKVVCSPEVKKIIKNFVKEFQKRKGSLVLGDFNTRNILVNADNSITAIDLEECGFSDPAHDIGTLLAHLLIFRDSYGYKLIKDIKTGF